MQDIIYSMFAFVPIYIFYVHCYNDSIEKNDTEVLEMVDIQAALQEVLDNRWYLAVRATRPDERYKVDEECRESYEWDLEHDVSTYHTTGQTAGGTCGISVSIEGEDNMGYCSIEELTQRVETAVEEVRNYGGEQIILIAGRHLNANYQMDDGEVRIIGAWVQAVIE